MASHRLLVLCFLLLVFVNSSAGLGSPQEEPGADKGTAIDDFESVIKEFKESLDAKTREIIALSDNLVTTTTETETIGGISVSRVVAQIAGKDYGVVPPPEVRRFQLKDRIVLVLLLSFPSGSSRLSPEAKVLLSEAFEDLFDSDRKDVIEKLSVFGHTDLEITDPDQNFDQRTGICEGIPHYSNECLGMARISEVQALLSAQLSSSNDYNASEIPVSSRYHPDPFLDTCNQSLDGVLHSLIDSKVDLESLIHDLRIKEDYEISQIRHRESAPQARIRWDREEFRRRFRPFRSVVVVANLRGNGDG